VQAERAGDMSREEKAPSAAKKFWLNTHRTRTQRFFSQGSLIEVKSFEAPSRAYSTAPACRAVN